MRRITFLVVITFINLSCQKDESSPTAASRVIRYEVSGNYTGSLVASYTTAGGGTTNESVSSLPWSKEIKYNTSVAAAILAFSGNGGVAGQQVTIIVKKGGSQISSTPAIAGSTGSFTITTPVVAF